ncbi:response regulator [Nocardioides pocheonensis]|uniref:Response regulator n=1 Tax=Nocardioides pocheonensis TaxID=661485 RepID=A0A3N0GYX7_9ACTN|nr:response regulator [Nocardioides pocheonensis]RNM17350.1 response regulator [Nocardioides pocheonensis]
MTRRVLVVDDDDAIREVAQMALELVAGWKVELAASGEEALEISAADPPDAVLLDVMMPSMDGPAVFARLQADPRTHGVPVVLLTAKVQPAERRRWDGLGVAGVLTKPFDPLRLAEDVAQLLGWEE